jgi:hypothetical protein
MVEFNIESIRESLTDYFRYFPQSWTISMAIFLGSVFFFFLLVFVILRVGIFKKNIDFYYRLPFALFIGSLSSTLLLSLITVYGSLYESWIIVGDYQSTLLVSFCVFALCLLYSFWLLAFRSRRDNFISNQYLPSKRIYYAYLEILRRKLKFLRVSSLGMLLPLLFLFGGGKNKFIYSFIIDNSVSMQDYGTQVTESVLHINNKTQGDFDLVFSYFKDVDYSENDYVKIKDLAVERNPDLINLSQTQYFQKSNVLSDFLYDLDNNLHNYKVSHTPLLMTIKQNSLKCNELFSISDYSRKVLFLISDGFESSPDYAEVAGKLRDPFNWKSPESSIYEMFDEIILIRINPESVPRNAISVFDNISEDEQSVDYKMKILNLEDEDNLNNKLRDYTYKDFKDFNILLIMGLISIFSIVLLFLIKI